MANYQKLYSHFFLLSLDKTKLYMKLQSNYVCPTDQHSAGAFRRQISGGMLHAPDPFVGTNVCNKTGILSIIFESVKDVRFIHAIFY